MQDQIQRVIEIKASQKAIFNAISNPDLVTQWFPETLEGEFKKGHHATFGFGEHGKNSVYIVDSRPYYYFSYRWVPGAQHFIGDVLSVANTLVEFTIEVISDTHCRLTLQESGFASLPKEIIETALQQNTRGWDFMLERLVQRMFSTS